MNQTNSKPSILLKLFPFMLWLKGYEPSFLKKDALAGLTVAAVLIPQSMAYAILAGLPPVYGLYAAVSAPIIGALWGSLRQLATGPIAIMSLLVLTTLSPMAEPGSPEFIELAFLLALLVGEIQGGLPIPQMHTFDIGVISSLIGPATVIALVSFAETYSVGKAISSETKQKLDVDQEFIGQGLANLMGSFFQSYPVSGSFSRTAINFASGAKTGIACAISSLTVIVSLLFLTPIFTYIPKTPLKYLLLDLQAITILFKQLDHVYCKNQCPYALFNECPEVKSKQLPDGDYGIDDNC